MVRSLHDAGMEVILDVVYNHTAEGNHLGPTLCFRGIDNQAYYRLVDDDQSFYMDYTGTGNSLNMRHPHSLQLIMDSLRYWVVEMHVDGFRFDLASTLAREFYDVDRLSSFFELVQQDPVISQVKLIAEPWDVGPGGYQVGNFPPQWTEWNGKYRDTVRDFWRGEPATLGEFASRFTGSPDLYEHHGRLPVASINFVTAHDGFTLADLVSYNDKHNEANGEDNNDGESHNRSYNCGVEGPSDDPAVLTCRAQQQRNFLATLLLSQGVPMIVHGDELGRSQAGNNNTYAQDSELTWIDWEHIDAPLVEFVATLTRLRREHPTFRRARFFDGRPVLRTEGAPVPDIVWFTPDARSMEPDDWGSGFGKAVGVYLDGDGIRGRDARGERITDRSVLVWFNAHDDTVDFTVPAVEYADAWDILVDTSGTVATDDAIRADRRIAVPGRCRAPAGPRAGTGRARHVGGCLRGGVGRRTHRRAGTVVSAPARDRVPRSTYRLQISREFTSMPRPGSSATSHEPRRRWLYVSPILTAEPGSNHGYDVVDHAAVDPHAAATRLRRFAGRPRRRPGVIVDIVPNHVGVAPPSGQPLVVGPAPARAVDSRFADAFDIDWDFAGGGALPVLGDEPTPELRVDVEDGSCATTSTDSRWRRHPARADPRDPRRSALRARQLATRRLRAQLPPVLRDELARRHPRRGADGLRGVAPRDTAAGSHDGLVDGLRVDHLDGLPTPAATSTTCVAPRASHSRRGEDPRGATNACPTRGDGGDDRLRRARRRRSRTRRPAGASDSTPSIRACAAGRPPTWDDLDPPRQTRRRRQVLRSEVLRLARQLGDRAEPTRAPTTDREWPTPSPSCCLLPRVPHRTCRSASSTWSAPAQPAGRRPAGPRRRTSADS